MASGATMNQAPAQSHPVGTGGSPAAEDMQAQLVHRLTDLALRGMAKVPVPADYRPSQAASDPAASQSLQPLKSFQPLQPKQVEDAATHCDACPVCPAAGGLMQRDRAASEPGDILVILEYPAREKPIHDDLSDPSSPNHLIYRLLARAGLLDQSAFAFALRSPVKSLPKQQWLETCASLWLAKELVMRSPSQVLCFGARARAAYDAASAAARAKPAAKGLENVAVNTFPSALELTNHPTWRQGVWEQVNALTLSKS